MNKNLNIFIIGILSATLLSACVAKEDTRISTIDDNSKEVTVVNIVEEKEEFSEIKDYFLTDKTEEYEFEAQLLESDNYVISYPELTNYKGALSMDYINQSIKSHAESLVENTSDVGEGDRLLFDYEIASQNDNFISIVFMGELPYENSRYKLMSTLIIDLRSTNTINMDNLFTDDKTILNSEFKKATKEINTTSFLPADYMIMHIEDKNLVFSYMENDMSTEYTEIKIPLEAIVEDLNIDFGQRPAS